MKSHGSDEGRFPFGRRSIVRPPRKPTAGACEVFILGVYPSALHVRWDLPTWFQEQNQPRRKAVGALAVDIEPMVFWNGEDATDRVEAWKETVGWKDGQQEGCWGLAKPAGNGTSGRAVEERVLDPLGIQPEMAWFTDSLPYFFIKRAGTTKRAQQADVIREVYEPFAAVVGLDHADLPPRPTPSRLVERASTEQRDRLRSEIAEARPKIIVTLGEESRKVMSRIADNTMGVPTQTLRGGPRSDYGTAGEIAVGAITATWYALTHTGNSSAKWLAAHREWARSTTEAHDSLSLLPGSFCSEPFVSGGP